MKQLLSTRLLALGVAIAAAALVVAVAQAGTSSSPRPAVALRNTALGPILVDAHGRTLYLFEKDRNGVSMCDSACVTYWPKLTSHGTPHAGKGVRQSLLGLGRARQVTYAGHPLYTFVGDKHAGQTSGEGLTNFGADWYAVSASGQKVERSASTSTGYGSSSSPGGGW
jgi:predicted lipoprotein with Yx(FWY)xxD motif